MPLAKKTNHYSPESRIPSRQDSSNTAVPRSGHTISYGSPSNRKSQRVRTPTQLPTLTGHITSMQCRRYRRWSRRQDGPFSDGTSVAPGVTGVITLTEVRTDTREERILWQPTRYRFNLTPG